MRGQYNVQSLAQCMQQYTTLRMAAQKAANAQDRRRLLACAQLWADTAWALRKASGDKLVERNVTAETVH